MEDFERSGLVSAERNHEAVSPHKGKGFQVRQLIFSGKKMREKLNVCFNEARLATSNLLTDIIGSGCE